MQQVCSNLYKQLWSFTPDPEQLLQKVDFSMAEFTSNEHCSPSGHGEDFVEEVEEGFQCPICHSPLKDPVFTRCGHRYCKECLDEHIGRYKFMTSSFQYCCSFAHLIYIITLDRRPLPGASRPIVPLGQPCPLSFYF